MFEPLKLADIDSLLEIVEERKQVAELDDVSRWIELALSRIPVLSDCRNALCRIEEYFDETGLEGDDLHLWRAYRDLFAQRFSRIYDDILEVTDVIAGDMFNHFIRSPHLKNVKSRFAEGTIPFTFLGRTEDYYFTYTHDTERPVAVISIPQGRISSVWNWCAIPHEIGHNIFAHFIDYERELWGKDNHILSEHRFKIRRLKYPLKTSTGKIIRLIMRSWLDEMMADIFGVLFIGPAFVMDRQEDAMVLSGKSGDAHISTWDVEEMSMVKHPTAYIRPLFCTMILRELDFQHAADALDDRWCKLHKDVLKRGELLWIDDVPASNPVDLLAIPIDEMLRIYSLILPVILHGKMKCLGGAALTDIIHFEHLDFVISTVVAEGLSTGVNEFARHVKPRHILSASRIAFERDPEKAETIHTSAMQGLVHFKKKHMN